MILHTVNKSPLEDNALGTCMQFLGDDDGIVLLEDGVYGALRNVDFGLAKAHGRVYALQGDVRARGLEARVRDDVHIIDYAAFVALCTEYDVVKNWS